MIEILAAGVLTTIQDLGRPGLAHLGVGRSGALDRPSLRLANRLVGNPEGAAALEITFGGLALRAERPMTVAVTGACGPVRVAGRSRDHNSPVPVLAGQVLELGMPTYGVRSYLAIGGGIAVPAVLGSRATDLLSGIGPAPVGAGHRIPIGSAGGGPAILDHAPVAGPSDPVLLRVLPGPRADWFTSAALATLGSESYRLSAQADRVGARLLGPALERARPGELASEGLVEGSVQVPADGQPLIFLADHPVTGGYPVIAVVHPDDLPQAAQARPGQQVRFRLQPAPTLR